MYLVDGLDISMPIAAMNENSICNRRDVVARGYQREQRCIKRRRGTSGTLRAKEKRR